ncbi:MAG: carboxymuconolactone decarboxylase family protein [Sphingomonas bacterium]
MPRDDFDRRFDDPDAADALARRFPEMHRAARNLWNVAFADAALTARMRELILLGIFASPAGHDRDMVDAQIDRAIGAGASDADVADVLISVAGIANHAMYLALPLADRHFPEEEKESGSDPAAASAVSAAREEFIRIRGFWNEEREILGRLIPDYFLAIGDLSTVATQHSALSPKEREMIFIAADASVSHMYKRGLRIHYDNACKAGLTFREVAAVLKIVGAVGLLPYIRASRKLAGKAG